MVEADKSAGGVEFVAPGEAFDVVDVVEEFVGEAEGVEHTHGVAEALDEAVLLAAYLAAADGVELFGLVEVFGGADAVGESCHSRNLALAQNQIVVDELFEGAQIDGVLVFFSDDEAEHVDVEVTGAFEVGDDQFHGGAADDVGCVLVGHDDGVVNKGR